MIDITSKQDEFERYLDSQIQELLKMHEEDLLEGVDAEALKTQSLAMVQSAKKEAGRRRMEAAKASLSKKVTLSTTLDTINIQEARHFLNSLVNDSRYTLAARSLDEMSNEDIRRLYAQFMHLQSQAGSDNDGT